MARMARLNLANELFNMLIGATAAAHFLIMHVNEGCMLDKHKLVDVLLSLPLFIYWNRGDLARRVRGRE